MSTSTAVDVVNRSYETVEQKLVDAVKRYRQAVSSQCNPERRYRVWQEVQALEEDMRQVGHNYDQAVRCDRMSRR